MPQEYDDDNGVQQETLQGRDWPCLRQFCVFMENRVGRLHELLGKLERSDLKVVALSVVDTVDFAVARLIVDNTDLARDVLQLSQFTVIENDILGVELPEGDQPFRQVLSALVGAELNISYTYPLLYDRGGHHAIAIHVDNIDQATRILQGRGLHVLTENDLRQDMY